MNKELKIVTMEELKKQMRVDFDDEDDIIKLYGLAAEESVIGMTRRTYEELEVWDGEGFPQSLRVAVLILAAHLYRNREPVAAVAQNAVPYTIDVLVKPFVKLSDRE